MARKKVRKKKKADRAKQLLKGRKKSKELFGNSSAKSTKSDSLAAAAYSEEPLPVKIEEEPSKEAMTLQDLAITVYGPPKIGKTTLASLIPGMYLLPTEPRYGSISCRKSPIPNWTSFREFVKYGEKHLEELEDIEMFGIDTADALSKFCMQYVCGRDGVAHPTDQEWGKGWEAYKDEWTYWLYRLASLGKGIMFVCHEKEREITSRGMKVTKLSPAAPTTCYTVMNNISDIILHMSFATKVEIKTTKKGKTRRRETVDDSRRCLYTKPSELRDGGDGTGLLPDIIEFETEAEAVKKILECFE
jgi:hypothetical protein